MYIQEVKIKNFLSIKDEIWTDLHSGLNIIVGENGRGKSTFLSAIRFVFTNQFSCTSQQEKAIFLNKKNSPARVDIIVNDPDNKFLLDQETIIFSRQLEPKIDTYFLNNKKITKADFFNLLEDAEFSTKNPFYVVPQGEATKIPKLSSKARLDIFEEFSGFKNLKDKRLLSQKLDQEFNSNMQILEKIQENFEDRLQFLEADVNEMKEYKRLSKQLKHISRIILNREIEGIENELQNLNQKAANLQMKKITLDNDFRKINENLEFHSNFIDSVENEMDLINSKEKHLSIKKIHDTKAKRKLEAKVNNLEKQVVELEKNELKIKEDLEKTVQKSEEFEEKLRADIPQFQEKSSDLASLGEQLTLKIMQSNEIIAKRGRVRQYKSKSERDSWIQNEIFVLDEQKLETESELNDVDQQIEIEEKTKSNLEKKIKTLEKHIELQKTKMESNFENVHSLKNEMSVNSKKIAELRDQLIEKEKILHSKKSELEKVEQKLSKILPKKCYNAMKSVKKVLEVLRERDESVEEYQNLLIDNFQVVNEKCNNLVESVVGNRLFEHVVESDDFASKIIDEMNRWDFPGEANFLPMNRLRFVDKDANVGNDVFSVLSFVTYEPKFNGVMRCIFGNKWVCGDMSTAVKNAREHKIDFYTLDGEHAYGNGILVGGSSQSLISRIEIYAEKKQLEQDIQILQQEMQIIENEFKNLKQSQLITENKINSPKIDLGEAKLAKMKLDLENEILGFKFLEGTLAELKIRKNNLEFKLKTIESKIENFRENLNEDLDLDSQLNEEEEDLLKNLESEITVLRKEREVKRKMVDALKERKEKFEIVLNDKLRKEIEDLKNKMETIKFTKEKLKLEIRDLQLKFVDFENSEALEQDNETLNTDIEDLKKKKVEAEEELKNMKPNREKLDENLKNAENQIEENNLKISELMSQRENCLKEISDLKIARSHDENLENEPTRNLQNRRNKLLKKTRKMKLDPKAIENHEKVENFKKEFQAEIEKLKLLENSSELEANNAISGNELFNEEFTKFAQNFDKYFKKLVTNGKGELILQQTSLDPELSDSYAGIDIRVTLSGQEKQSLKSLSGGEKSIVSLAFILSAAKNNPPPFFIFDEFDAALSESNSQLFVKIIKKISQGVQIFMSTFKEKIMNEGNQLFQVTMLNNNSSIQAVSSQDENIED